MKRFVFDSYAVLSYGEKEPSAFQVAAFIKKALRAQGEIFLCVVNWGEVYYMAFRKGGKELAELYRLTLEKLPIQIVDVDKELTLQAAQLKAQHKISYADAYAAALSQFYDATLVTGDKEFQTLVQEIKIQWL